MIVIHMIYTFWGLARLLNSVTNMFEQCFCALFWQFQWSKGTKNHTQTDLNIFHNIYIYIHNNLSTNPFGSLINNFNSQFHAKLSTFADMHIYIYTYE